MNIEIIGKNLQVRDDLRERALEKLEKYDKYFHGDVSARVVFSHTGNLQIVEITVPLKGGAHLRAEEYTYDMIKSLDGAAEKLERQMRKYKTSLHKRYRSSDSIRFENIPEDPSAIEDNFKIVRNKSFPIKPMDPIEAILQMNLLDHAFFVFTNSQTGDVNVVYKRNSGDYGLIEPTK